MILRKASFNACLNEAFRNQNRMLMEFSKSKTSFKMTSLCILNEDSSYTDEFKDLTKDFYLNF